MAKQLATMAGSVWKITVQLGDEVAEGQDIVILESMKMEIPIATERSGKVTNILVNEGDFVNEGDALLEID